MAGINYPGGIDSFPVPSDPENTPLSSAGSGTRDLVQSIADLGLAVVALEGLAAVKSHTHAGGSDGTQILLQSHTHGGVDTDTSTSAIHHTIGTGPNQAAPGTHVHDYTGSTITNKPDFICTSTTRPIDPALWTVIRETDTNCVRAWASFPNNTLTPGISAVDSFLRSIAGVTYDQTGPGAYGAGVNSLSEQHNFGVAANAMLVAVTVFEPSAPSQVNWNVTATCAGATMTKLGAVDTGGSLTGFTVVFGLANITTGQGNALGISVNATDPQNPSTTAHMSMVSVSYNNVGAFGPIQTAGSNIGFTVQTNTPSAPGEMVFSATVGGLGSISSTISGTLRKNLWPDTTGSYCSLLVQDTQGSALVNSMAQPQAIAGGMLSVNLIPKTINLGTSLYSQSYVTGTTPTCGAMAVPSSGAAQWVRGQNVAGRCIAVPLNNAHTLSGDQDFTFTTGSAFPSIISPTSPTDDIYARRSDDGQTYVRLALTSYGATLSYTHGGPAAEVQLGTVSTGTQSTTIPWEFKVTGRTFLLYRGGVQVMSIVDQQNVTAEGPGYLGWAWGMSAIAGSTDQVVPASVVSLAVNDLPIYTTQPIWQLIPGGVVPHISAETHVGQQIVVGNPVAAFFDTILEDLFGFFGQGSIGIATTIPQTVGVTITEPGHYDIRASIPWDPAYYGFDQATLGFTVNGQDIGRKNRQFMRGNGYVPGFPQTLELAFNWKFAAGDVLRVVASHNSDATAWLYFNNSPAAKQAVNLDLVFTGP